MMRCPDFARSKVIEGTSFIVDIQELHQKPLAMNEKDFHSSCVLFHRMSVHLQTDLNRATVNERCAGSMK